MKLEKHIAAMQPGAAREHVLPPPPARRAAAALKGWMLTWFPVAWPDRMRRVQVAAQYRDIGKEALADIAMRNFLFEPFPRQFDPQYCIGRRDAALEIFQMARVDPRDVGDISVTTQGADK